MSAGSVPDVAFPLQARGMTNKERGPAVPPVGVRWCISV